MCNFNSHAHVERDSAQTVSCQICAISTHTLTWSVTLGSTGAVWQAWHFNSHAHVERDSPYMTDSGEIGISTHTLTWSVTSLGEDDITATLISTHTLTWSVTSAVLLCIEILQNFNSHAHVERDIFDIFSNAFEGISTHTLTWSVTEMLCSLLIVLNISTHTLTWSVTLK